MALVKDEATLKHTASLRSTKSVFLGAGLGGSGPTCQAAGPAGQAVIIKLLSLVPRSPPVPLGSWVGKEGIAQLANNCCHQSGLTLPWPWGHVQEHTVMARLSPG